MNAIEIKDVCKSYKNFALDHVSLTLPGGCVMGLVGENGAGKSTLIRTMLGMIRQGSGSITLLGHDTASESELVLAKDEIGAVLDEVGIPEGFRAKEISRVMDGIFTRWHEDQFYDYLRKFSVPADKKFKELSRGMKMKLGIAAALSHEAKLLILDEATNGLDPLVRDEITDLFYDFTRDEQHAVLISSHIVSDLEKICDYITFLHEGKVLLSAEKDRLLEEYCIARCSEEEAGSFDHEAILGMKRSQFGTQLLIRRNAVPKEMQVITPTLEELFVFMVKGDA
ncbi:MAG: ABC transporter ATP-binding protein [Oscillospiraceae bacterium]|nr:ABC transporter ATP-binding protein [Oscillospiraceae bacterium]